MSYKVINLRQKSALFTQHWAPKVVAEMYDYQFKVVKLQGEFIWRETGSLRRSITSAATACSRRRLIHPCLNLQK